MPASTSQRRTKPKVRRNSDVIGAKDGSNGDVFVIIPKLLRLGLH